MSLNAIDKIEKKFDTHLSIGDLELEEAEDWVGYFIDPPPKTISPNTPVNWTLSYAAIPNDHVSLGMLYNYHSIYIIYNLLYLNVYRFRLGILL